MRSLFSLVIGMVLGALIALGAMKYHVVRASDGFHVVAKTRPQLKDVFVDIRSYDVAKWKEHAELAEALVKADKGDLIADQIVQEEIIGPLGLR